MNYDVINMMKISILSFRYFWNEEEVLLLKMESLPPELLMIIFGYCDFESLLAFKEIDKFEELLLDVLFKKIPLLDRVDLSGCVHPNQISKAKKLEVIEEYAAFHKIKSVAEQEPKYFIKYKYGSKYEFGRVYLNGECLYLTQGNPCHAKLMKPQKLSKMKKALIKLLPGMKDLGDELVEINSKSFQKDKIYPMISTSMVLMTNFEKEKNRTNLQLKYNTAINFQVIEPDDGEFPDDEILYENDFTNCSKEMKVLMDDSKESRNEILNVRNEKYGMIINNKLTVYNRLKDSYRIYDSMSNSSTYSEKKFEEFSIFEKESSLQELEARGVNIVHREDHYGSSLYGPHLYKERRVVKLTTCM